MIQHIVAVLFSLLHVVPAPQGMEAPKAIEPLREAGEDQGTTVEGPPNILLCTATTGIIWPQGCASATWRYTDYRVLTSKLGDLHKPHRIHKPNRTEKFRCG